MRFFIPLILVRSEMHIRGMKSLILCPTWFTKIEATHTFMECPRAIKIWFGSRSDIRIQDRSEI
ncbi:hypothetical protein TSUD_117240 [Trifolium subterraneum]|nr:hypothetical protein TSUD_117240 [Trifolium subterraneum]